jgi:hypothetical protein
MIADAAFGKRAFYSEQSDRELVTAAHQNRAFWSPICLQFGTLAPPVRHTANAVPTKAYLLHLVYIIPRWSHYSRLLLK